ncbi:MAG: acyl-CoA desaturase [Gammaproteobacteria bacterium]|nr:acyl-CoA desaturase [Gammaproteobacteria bacterium]
MYTETFDSYSDAVDTTPLRHIRSDKQALEVYAELKQALQKTDFFKPDPMAYVFRGAWVTGGALAVYSLFLSQDNWGIKLLACVLLGFLCVQSAAVAHEAAHGAVTRSKSRTQKIGLMFMNVFFGSSFAFWMDKHNQHHRKPNSCSDPDIRAGFFNFTEVDARYAKGLSRFLTRRQHILIWPLSSLMGFSFKIGSIRYLMKSPSGNRLDIVALVLHYLLWLVPGVFMMGLVDTLICYFLITWFAGAYLAFIFITNHIGNPKYEDCETALGFLRQAATARNTSASPVITSLCNGLNSHIEHHLFPYVPFTRLASGREITRQVLEKYGIRYHQTSVIGAFKECYAFNKQIAQYARQESLAC